MGMTPTPENAAEIADMIVGFVTKTYGVTLDYSVYSLRQVDGIIEDLRSDHTFEKAQGLLAALGCDAGEVFVRHAGGTWRTTASMGMSGVSSAPIVVRMPDESGCNPIGKAYKRFQNGEADNIAWLYHTLVEIPREKLVPKTK